MKKKEIQYVRLFFSSCVIVMFTSFFLVWYASQPVLCWIAVYSMCENARLYYNF